tara:strand:+ start:5462 stop:6037 length:576 start_codon:yes stop_codon:yes gene_type:complete
MTEIYEEIAKLSDKFNEMAFGITTDKNKIDNAVQELMLYFLQMNPETLKKIYDKDGIQGITKYGAVALRRSLTSPRSNFFYKYEKYYTHIDGGCYSNNKTYTHNLYDTNIPNHKNIYNFPTEKIDNTQLLKLQEIDVALEDFTWYDKKVFELYYYEGNTLDSLAKKTSISRNSLFTTIDKVRTILKKKLNE